MIDLINVSKQYLGTTINNDSGIYLWIKNFTSLTSNRAAPLLALNNISFSIAKGEIFGIYGENGAGKTTLIKILSGLLHPSSGIIKIDNRSDRKHIKSTVSYISTNGWMGLEWQLSAKENLILYGHLFGMSGRELENRCDAFLEEFGMTGAKDRYISKLSAGMRQKITIARGLILDRPIVFYDEPSVSLDVQSAGNLRAFIKADAEKNHRTAIIASHNTEDLSICTRIMFLSKGEIIALGSMDKLAGPLSAFETIEIIYLKQKRDLPLEYFRNIKIPGIERIIHGSGEGERDVQNIKIFVRKKQFELNRLIQHLIENNITVQSIKPTVFTLNELYEYYLKEKGAHINVS